MQPNVTEIQAIRVASLGQFTKCHKALCLVSIKTNMNTNAQAWLTAASTWEMEFGTAQDILLSIFEGVKLLIGIGIGWLEWN